jgi:hypothetical protein
MLHSFYILRLLCRFILFGWLRILSNADTVIAKKRSLISFCVIIRLTFFHDHHSIIHHLQSLISRLIHNTQQYLPSSIILHIIIIVCYCNIATVLQLLVYSFYHTYSISEDIIVPVLIGLTRNGIDDEATCTI